MFSLQEQREREQQRAGEGNSVRELACNDPRGSRCPGTRTNLLLFTFLLLRGRRELRRCIPRDFSS